VQCHTTGFDDEYNFAGNLVTQGLNQDGYDDNPRAALQAVQCEACHGPMGPNPALHQPQTAAAMDGAACNKCHEQNEEWASSGHGAVLTRMTREEMFEEWGGSSCNYCHISEGFMALHGSPWAAEYLNAESANQVNCATCHEAHGNGNEYQIRTVDPVRLVYGGPDSTSGYTISGWGNGQLCAQCHHARRSQSQINGQINNGSAHPGPHESPQADMFAGRGSYEIAGYTYNREDQHAAEPLTDKCIICHMSTIPRGQAGGPYNGHSFAPDTRGCNTSGCHNTTTFDVGGVQTEIHGLIEELAALLPHDSTGAVMEAMDTLSWSRKQREAGYAYLFVESDGSKGVHNYPYAKSLLENAITYLNAP
jgi:hypothetical protein